MIRIHRVYDDTLPRAARTIARVIEILRAQFPNLREKEFATFAEKLRNPFKHGFRSILFVAEGIRGEILGFALLSHDPTLDFCLLDYVATDPEKPGRGIGDALYERVRVEARSLGAAAIVFECLPDDPALCPDPDHRALNAARLKFYERFGARPVANTLYETSVADSPEPPYLVADELGGQPLRRDHARALVRAVLERRYADLCPRDYIDRVVESFRDDPWQLRPPRYVRKPPAEVPREIPADRRVLLVANDNHLPHHVHERGYVETPARIDAILKDLLPSGLFRPLPPRAFPDRHLAAIHAPDYLEYLRNLTLRLKPEESVYPYVFPLRNRARPPRELAIRAGYYCIDTFTPLSRAAFAAARRAVDAALTAAQAMLYDHRLAYALLRPPGHHAESRCFGGFCYFNSAACAAQFLSDCGRVAMLDVDYHHGNGQQEIFYRRADVLTVSLHGHPRFAYPYFSGFEDERGEGPGEGFNLNIALPEKLDGEGHRRALERALKRIVAFDPLFLVVCLGLDTAAGDPTGTWRLGAADYQAMGRMIGGLKLPTLVVQEGGYTNRKLGANARRFFEGLQGAAFG